MESYYVPKKTNADIRYIGNSYHLARIGRWKTLLAHVNADFWKGELHQRLTLPPDSPLALLLFDAADATTHREFAEHLTAEKQVERWIEGKGEVICWERVHRANHYLDSSYSAVAAGTLLLALGGNQQGSRSPQPQPPSRIREMKWRR